MRDGSSIRAARAAADEKRVQRRLKKSGILRGYRAFARVLAQGKTLKMGSLRCSYVVEPVQRESPLYVGFAVSKSVRRAVDRNRIKRWLREAYRRHNVPLEAKFHYLPSTLQVVFLYTAPSAMSRRGGRYDEVDAEMKQLICRLLEE